MKSDTLILGISIAGLLGLVGLMVAGAIGYVLNLIAIAHWADPTGVLVLRIIGALIAPIGAFLGWLA